MEHEKKLEGERLAKINANSDETEKQKLTRENEQAISIVSDKVAKLQVTHLQELRVLSGQ